MKKSKLFLLILIMMICILPSISVKASNIKINFKKIAESLSSAYGDNYEQYLENNNYEDQIAQAIYELMQENYGDSYPDYYGGMYISDDSKNLVIQIIKDKIPMENTNDFEIYNKMISMDSTILIEFVNYSFNDLMTAKELISDNIQNKDNFSSIYVDVINNAVAIELLDNSAKKQQEFKNNFSTFETSTISYTNSSNILNSNLVLFKQGTKNEVMSTIYDLKPGQYFQLPGEEQCSIAFRVKYNGKPGFMTAGHCFMIDGLKTDFRVGAVRFYQFADNEKYDYAFVETSIYNPVNTTAIGMGNQEIPAELEVTAAPVLVVGRAIGKMGGRTGCTFGKIVGLNNDVYYPTVGKTIKGLVSSDLLSKKGDSGGVIFIPITNFRANPIGILSGGNSVDQTHFTDIHDLPAEFRNRY